MPLHGRQETPLAGKAHELPEPAHSMFIRVKLGGDGQSRGGSSLRPTTAGSTGGHAAGTLKSASYNNRPSPGGSMTGAAQATAGLAPGGQ